MSVRKVFIVPNTETLWSNKRLYLRGESFLDSGESGAIAAVLSFANRKDMDEWLAIPGVQVLTKGMKLREQDIDKVKKLKSFKVGDDHQDVLDHLAKSHPSFDVEFL